MFKETITNVSLEVLQSELTVCEELLELEPDNKCECEREEERERGGGEKGRRREGEGGKRERGERKSYKEYIFLYFRVRFDYSSAIRSH